VSQETSNRSFDDLARALAEGSISRRRALKLFAGTAIAALIPARALAQQQKVTICHKPGTPDEETKEVSQSAVASHLRHGDQLGPCVMCLPNGDTCSTGGTPCCSGNCSNGICCASGRVGLSNGTCALLCNPDCPVCGSFGVPSCLAEATSGASYCRGDASGACTTTNDCPTGQFCSPSFGCAQAC
jgi:hypothetical protein